VEHCKQITGVHKKSTPLTVPNFMERTFTQRDYVHKSYTKLNPYCCMECRSDNDLCIYVKSGFHTADFYEAHNYCTAFLNNSCQHSLNISEEKFREFRQTLIYVIKSRTTSIAPPFTRTIILNKFCIECLQKFHEKPKNNLVLRTRSQRDGPTDGWTS